MFMTDRDRRIVLAVGRFGQLKTGHVRSLFFDALSSTPSDRALLRLTKRRYLARIERPLAGGNKGGSGQYVYQLGSEGWKLCRRETRYWPYRAVNAHMLAIADVFVSLKTLEAEGRYQVSGFATEPDTWMTVAGADLRPDLHVELVDSELRRSLDWWLEVDMGTERQKQLSDKMSRYYHAWQYSTEDDMFSFPRTVFLVPDDERVKELRWLISRLPEEARILFDVKLMSEFPKALLVV